MILFSCPISMGFFDRLRERNTPQEQAETVTQSFEGTDFQPSPDQAQDLSSNDELRNFAADPGQGRTYNPYEGINAAVDPRVLRNVYKLPSQPEFLFSEESTVHKRSLSENLTYYTGVGYLTGRSPRLHATAMQDRTSLISFLPASLFTRLFVMPYA